MPLGALPNSHELVAIQQTLEDEFCDWLSPAQIQQVLHGAGGELDAARAACAAAAAAAQEQQQQQHLGSEAQAASQDEPAGSPSHRYWWPQSPFCPPPSGARATAAARPIAQPPRLVPHHLPQPSQQHQHQQQQAGMQPAALPSQRASAASSRGTVASASSSSSSSSSRQSPAAVTLRRLLGPAAGGSGGTSSGTAPRQPGILTRSAGASGSSASLGGGSLSASRTPGTAGTAGAAPAAARQREPLHPHYAAVFLTDRSREQLLQHVAPLHETISADHMTMTYKPTLHQCRGLPLGREAALFIAGVAADYRAQAVAVEHPSWVPFLSESAPHVTISVGEEVPAKEAGDLTAAALANPGLITPVARLKLLQGVVGVQLSDGRRLFSVEELEAALAQAAALEQQQQQQQQQGQQGQPPGLQAGGAPRILKRGQALPLPMVPGGGGASTAAAQPDTVTGMAATPPPAAPPATAAASSSSGSKAPAWDLDALLDQLHLAEPVPTSTVGTAGSRQAQQPAPPPPPEQPRRGLLKLPAAVASEMAAPRSMPGTAGAAPAARSPIAIARRPVPPPKAPAQQPRQQQLGYGAASAAGEWVEPASPVQPSFSKSAAEEAAEAAAAGEPLDMVSSLAFLLPQQAQQQRQQQQPAAAADLVSPAIPPEPPLPSPKMLQGAGTSSSEAGDAVGAASGAAGGYETSGSEASSSVGPAGSGPAAAVDADSKQLLQLQYPELHELVVETALRMHGGSLPEATQFLAVLDQQQRELGPAAAAGRAGGAPAQPTLGAYLQGLLPETSASRAAAGAGYDLPASSSAASGYADSSYDFGPAMQRPGAGRGRGSGGVTGGWQVQPGGSGGGGRGRGKGRRGSGGTLAGDDPMSVTERQAMNTHLTAKRIYTQAAQEAFNRGQVALSKELQATARVHGDAASEARRRANASAFRSTNATVQNTFTLDLHGQHVEEALASLERYLVTLGGLGHPGGVMLQVITGAGRHSAGNQPRVLPAVVRYLSDAGYKFEGEEGNPGIINVAIGC